MHDWLTRFIISLPIFLLAVVLHEVAHGYIAYLCGDDTAKRAGRLTLSPVAHLDPLGAVCFFLSSLSGFGFGWAKPVPVVRARLRNPDRDDLLVTLAGPAANLAQAVAWTLLIRLIHRPLLAGALGPSLTSALILFCLLGLNLNLVLTVFNLLPIPPLDGSHVAFRLLGVKDPYRIEQMARIGWIVLLILVVTPAFGLIARTVIEPIASLLLSGL